MRERAEAATHGPWVKTVWPNAIPGVYSQPIEETREFDPEIARTLDGPDAEHIASWHPAVALAVADWLDDMARLSADGDSGGPLVARHALAVATAYLGEPTPKPPQSRRC
jgi:hypothetical protein